MGVQNTINSLIVRFSYELFFFFLLFVISSSTFGSTEDSQNLEMSFVLIVCFLRVIYMAEEKGKKHKYTILLLIHPLTLYFPNHESRKIDSSCFCEGLVGEAGALALYEDELDIVSVRALLAAGPNHLGAAQPLTVATSDIIPPMLHTQMLSGPGAKAAASAHLVAAYLPRMCTDEGICPAWRPAGATVLHDVIMSRYETEKG